MAVDRTGDWREALRRLQHDAPTHASTTASATRSTAATAPFVRLTRGMLDTIRDLARFLALNEARYLDFESRLRYRRTGALPPLSSGERDAIEADATRSITQICRTIDELTGSIVAARTTVSGQTFAHRLGVVKALNEALQVASARFRAMQEVRYQAERRAKRKRLDEMQPVATAASAPLTGQRAAWSHDVPPPFEFSQSELVTLEQENASLAREMATMVDAVREMERQMVEIRQLQTIISEQLSEQSGQIDILLDNAISSVHHVQDANAQLQTYRESTASFRLFMVVFLIGAALCLLFLHWYTDR